MSSVHADVLRASSRSRAPTFVLTAVVQMCAMPVPCPSPCANVYTAIQGCSSSTCGYSQASCQLAATLQRARKLHLQKGFAAGGLGLPAHTYLRTMLLSHPERLCHHACAQHPSRSADSRRSSSQPLPKAVIQATAKAKQGGNRVWRM